MKSKRTSTMLLSLILLLSAMFRIPGAWIGAALAEEDAEEQVLVFKTPLCLPGLSDLTLAESFNRLHPGKRIVIEDLPDERLIATEIMSGEADYIINGAILDPFKYSTSGQFYDLYEWMDADPDFHREDYYENLFTAMECDGHLYAMPAVFDFAPMWIYLNGTIAEALGASYQLLDTITPSEILDLYESAKAQELMAEDTPLVFEDIVAPGVLLVLSTESASHIDFSARTTNFSSPEFISLLERTKQAYTERRIEEAWGMSTSSSFSRAVTRQETTSLIKCDSVALEQNPLWESGLTKSRLAKMPDGLMGPLVLQTNNGVAKAYALVSYMVPKSCSNPELAWEFLKFCISPLDEEKGETPGTVNKTALGLGFPLSKKNMETYAKMYRTFGSDFDASLAKLEERIAEISIFDYYIQAVETLSIPIVSQYYDYGFITAEECAKQIDERAFIYLNE